MLAYQYQPDGTLKLTDLPEPQQPDGLVVQVKAAGICGTDLKIARGEHRFFPPGTTRIPGHEFSGVVCENNSGDPRFTVGTRVVLAPNIACGKCATCLAGRQNLCEHYESFGLTFDGGFAEKVGVPPEAIKAGNVLIVPDDLDLETACLMEPVAAVVRGLRPLNLKASDTMLICGAGPMGLIALIVAKQMGVQRVLVSQTSPTRRALAATFGADGTFDPRESSLPDQIMEATNGWGADVVLDATPKAEVFADSLKCAAVGGRINFFAGLPSNGGVIPLDANLIHYRELTVTGTTANTNADCVEALDLVAANPEAFRSLITERLPLTEIPEAFALAASGGALKVISTGVNHL